MACITQDQVLQKPQTFDFPSFGQESPPFTLNGAPITIVPQSPVGYTEQRRKGTATTDTSILTAYFASDNYYPIKLATENILNGNSGTSLRFNNLSYNHLFTALHAPVWTFNDNNGIQLSLFFTNNQKQIFHICIPVQLNGTSTTENLFLKSWLSGAPIPSSGLTMNDLLNFRGYEKDVRFATLSYCLKFNYVGDTQFDLWPYTFCIFNTPLRIDPNSVPNWLASDPGLNSVQTVPTPETPMATYRRKTFDEIFNMYFNTRKFIYGTPDPFVIGSEQHFDNTRTQTVTVPAYFKCITSSLSGKAYTSGQLKDGIRGLQNVKCYPIDLVSQVDKVGNIYIDDQTHKPINIDNVLKTSNIPLDINNQEILDQQANADKVSNNIIYWLTFFLTLFILTAIIVAIVVFLFRGKSFSHATVVPMSSVAMPEAATASAVASVAAAIVSSSNSR